MTKPGHCVKITKTSVYKQNQNSQHRKQNLKCCILSKTNKNGGIKITWGPFSVIITSSLQKQYKINTIKDRWKDGPFFPHSKYSRKSVVEDYTN